MIKKYAEYNFWANTQITNSILQIENEKLNKQIVSSFSSIRKTVYHIWDAETIWLERISHSNISLWPPSKIFDDDSTLDILVSSSKKLLDFVNLSTDEFFNECTSYNDSKGNLHSTNNEEILHHVFNHSTFHRGQIITMLRQIGFTQIPQTDFINFIRK